MGIVRFERFPNKVSKLCFFNMKNSFFGIVICCTRAPRVDADYSVVGLKPGIGYLEVFVPFL